MTKKLPEGLTERGTFVDVTGFEYHVHPEDQCALEHCAIHNPSKHHMNRWPRNLRHDSGLIERICSHGVGHPDPDSLAYFVSIGREDLAIHGCDGCCGPS